VLVDGEFNLNIDNNGNFVSGEHRPALPGGGGLGQPVTLKKNALSTTEIEVEEVDAPKTVYHGFVTDDPLHGRKVVIGRFKLPGHKGFDQVVGSEGRDPANLTLGQINGTWVATQP
jgi:hypothetical protein